MKCSYDLEISGEMSPFNRLVLCSKSPRRRELLAKYNPILRSAETEERAIEKKWMEVYKEDDFVHRVGKTSCQLALAKLEKVQEEMENEKEKLELENALFLACDTMVAIDGKTYNKPKNKDQARKMLLSYLGREHQVATGVAMKTKNSRQLFYSLTTVAFSRKTPYIEKLLDEYVQTGLPLDKAGAYGIQELDPAMIDYIAGDFFTIIGLPLGEIERRLAPYWSFGLLE